MRKIDHPLYTRWRAMKGRCYRPDHKAYARYGGKGIKICDRWLDFWLFVDDVGEPPSEIHTIDRIRSEEGYSPDNFRWATPFEQQRNMNRNIWVEVDGVRLTVKDWADRHGVTPCTYYGRIRAGWDHVDAVTIPPKTLRKYADKQLENDHEPQSS